MQKRIRLTILVVMVICIVGFVLTGQVAGRETVKIKDMVGRTIKIPTKINRIVALGPGALRLITYLEKTEQVVGVEDFEKRDKKKPYILAHSELQKLPNIGPQFGGDAELILKQKPDIVFFTYTTRQQADRLESKIGIPVFVIRYGGPAEKEREQFYKALYLLGQVLNKEDRATALINYFRSTIKDLKLRTCHIENKKQLEVYTGGIGSKGAKGILSTEPAYPPFSFINAHNAAADLGFEHVVISKEKLLEWDPDLIFIDEGGYSLVINDLQRREYQNLQAVKNDYLYGVLPYNYYTTNYATVLANAYYIGKVLYPEQFQDINPAVKANQIYKQFVGKAIYKEMKSIFGGYKKLKKAELSK